MYGNDPAFKAYVATLRDVRATLSDTRAIAHVDKVLDAASVWHGPLRTFADWIDAQGGAVNKAFAVSALRFVLDQSRAHLLSALLVTRVDPTYR